MRAHLLTFCSIPALALLAVACSPPGESTTDSAAAPAATTESAAAPEAAAPEPAATEVAAAEPAAAAPAAAEPAAAETAAAETAAAPASEEMEAALAAVALRKAPMKLISWNFGPLGGMLRGNAPFDAAVVQTNAARIAVIAPMIPGVFEQDVRSFDVDTRARDAIWDSKADFDAKAAALAEAASAVATAAATGDEAATKAALQTMGGACGSCHDDFRENPA
jgi:cytochrome c556